MRSGRLRHTVTLDNSVITMDGDGGYTTVWTALAGSPVAAEIKPATARDLERVGAGTVISTATHVITMRYLVGVTTQTRITFNGRLFSVTGVSNPEERNIELVCVCEEVVA